jgi:hypothetical protein
MDDVRRVAIKTAAVVLTFIVALGVVGFLLSC